MRDHLGVRAAAASVLIVGAQVGAQAATTCVNTPTQLAAALLAAQNNGQDDTILLETGNYALTAELQYFAAPGETHRLAIVGGQTAGCAGYASSGDTVLDGQNAVRILYISAHGEVDIGRITFQHGNPTQYFGGALNVSSDGDIYLFSSAFVANQTASGNGGGAAYIATVAGHSAYLWSNLFLANTSGAGAIYATNDGNLYLTGNTILANTLINHTGLTGGVDLAGSGHYWISNNILWNNDNSDVYDQVGHADYANNDIGVRAGFAPLSESNDLNVDPGFSGLLSVRPGPASPLVNAGLDMPPGGVGGCCDPSGAPRVQGKHVDIGAYETDVLFRNGYEG